MEREQALIRRGRALAGLSALDLEWNVREQAEQAASEGLDLGQQYADEELLAQSSMILAWVQHADGETAQAQQLLHELVTRTKRPLLLRAVQADQARLALAAGDLAAVQRWSTSRVQLDGNLPRLQQEREALILARLLIAQDQAEAALPSLEEWQAEAHDQGRSGSELEILALKALAYFSHNNLPQASQTLSEALALALPEGYQRLFLDEGQPMAALLQAIIPEVSEAPLLTYIQTLLAAFPKDENGGFAKRGEIKNQKPLIEPLSAQEERVLRLLAGGLSNQEIAQELIVSLNTVKTQVKSIYRKLQVHSRREARNAARRLNLV
jgi:LuxR family maltose regulon positive regulatory protein